MNDNALPPARGNGAEGVSHPGSDRKARDGTPAERAVPPPSAGVTPNGATTATPNGATARPARPGPRHAAEEPDESGAFHYEGDDENGRAPGSALLLVILSLVGGALYLWQYAPLMRRFNWINALTLKTPALVLVGAVVLIFGAVLLLRYGMVWASRLACLLILAPMLRLVVDSIIVGGPGSLAPAFVALLISGGPVLLVLALSVTPALQRWRSRRQDYVKSRRN